MSRLDVRSICKDCGTIGYPQKVLSGAFWVEVLLYIVGFALIPPTFLLSLLIPIAYTVRRHTAATRVCFNCGGKMVSITTPIGEKLIEEMGVEVEEEKVRIFKGTASNKKKEEKAKTHFAYTPDKD